jgi:hypothetical protein
MTVTHPSFSARCADAAVVIVKGDALHDAGDSSVIALRSGIAAFIRRGLIVPRKARSWVICQEGDSAAIWRAGGVRGGVHPKSETGD